MAEAAILTVADRALAPPGHERLTAKRETSLRLSSGEQIELIMGKGHIIRLRRGNDGVVKISMDGFQLPDPDKTDVLLDEVELPVNAIVNIRRDSALADNELDLKKMGNFDRWLKKVVYDYHIHLPNKAVSLRDQQIDFTDIGDGPFSGLSITVGTVGRRAEDNMIFITARQPAPESPFLIVRTQCLRVLRAATQIGWRDLERDIRLQGDELPGEGEKWNAGAQVFSDLAANLVCVRDDGVQAPVLFEPFHGGLGPHLRNAGDIVRGIANERQVIDDQLRRHAVLLFYACRIEHRIAHGIHERDAVVDDLGEVLVAGGNEGRYAVSLRLARECGDDIVGLDAVRDDQRQSLGLENRMHRFDLADEVGRHGRTVGLVFWIDRGAEGLLSGIENHREIIGCIIGEQLAHHVDDAIDRPGTIARGVAEIAHGVEGAEEIIGSVYENEFFCGHAAAPVNQGEIAL